MGLKPTGSRLKLCNCLSISLPLKVPTFEPCPGTAPYSTPPTRLALFTGRTAGLQSATTTGSSGRRTAASSRPHSSAPTIQVNSRNYCSLLLRQSQCLQKRLPNLIFIVGFFYRFCWLSSTGHLGGDRCDGNNLHRQLSEYLFRTLRINSKRWVGSHSERPLHLHGGMNDKYTKR